MMDSNLTNDMINTTSNNIESNKITNTNANDDVPIKYVNSNIIIDTMNNSGTNITNMTESITTAESSKENSSTIDAMSIPKLIETTSDGFPILQKIETVTNNDTPIESNKTKETITKSNKSSDHHYNPYIYNQPKLTKSSIQFDLSQIQEKKLINNDLQNNDTKNFLHENTGLYYTLTNDSIPSFKISKSDYNLNPIQFYESVKDLGSKYGCIKLSFTKEPESDSVKNFKKIEKFGMSNEQFWFKTIRQSMSSIEDEQKNIIKFHEDLFRFHSQINEKNKNHPLNKIPNIDKRTLDLYRLRNCVLLRGGFKPVCDKKLWAQIGRELGYSGRIMSSLSTSLRSAYIKVLLDFDLYEEEKERLKRQAQEIIQQPLENGQIVIQNENPLKRSLSNENENDIDNKKLKSERNYYQMGRSSIDFTRMRDYLMTKNVPTFFDRTTETKKGLTDTSFATLPNYDFTLWNKGLETFDIKKYDEKNSPIYNIKQFYEKSQKQWEKIQSIYSEKFPELFSVQNNLPISAFEDLYFHILSDENSNIEIDSGINLSSLIHNSNQSKDIGFMKDDWNLQNIPLHKDSLLKYLQLDKGNLTRTNLDIGMLFSLKNWSSNDHFLPSIDYNHLGSTKLWYTVVPDDMEKFENLLKDIYRDLKSDQNYGNDNIDVYFEASEIFRCYAEANKAHTNLKNEESNNDGTFIVESESENLPRNSMDVQIPMSVLKRHGIKLLKATQEPDTYIFKYPKTYTCTIGSGFYVSENVLFAPQSWLSFALEGSKWLSNRKILPALDIYNFLMNISLTSNDTGLTETTDCMLNQIIINELDNRSKFRNIIGIGKELSNKFDFISDISFKSTGFSKVVVTDKKNCITISLQEFLNIIKKKDDSEWYIFDKPCKDNEQIEIKLHVFHNDKLLKSILKETINDETVNDIGSNKSLEDQLEQELDILTNVTFKSQRIPINALESLLQKFDISSTYSVRIKDAVKSVQDLITECKMVLSTFNQNNKIETKEIDFGKGFDLRELPLPSEVFNVERFQILEKKLKLCSIDFPEMHEVFGLREKISQIQNEISNAIKSKDMRTLKDVYFKTLNYSMMDTYLVDLIHWISKLAWLEVYDDVFVKDNDRYSQDHITYSLSAAYSFLNFGIKYCDEEDIEMLEAVKIRISKSQDIITRIGKLLRIKKHNSKILVKEILRISKVINSEKLIVDRNVTDMIETISANVEQIKSDMTPLWKLLSVNETQVGKLVKALDIESLEVLELFPRFSGTSKDKRMVISEVTDHKLLNKQIKACKSWIQELNKTCDRSRSEKLENVAIKCLHLESDPYTPISESSSNQTIFCFCRQGDVGSTMVECEVCKEWYHTNCINQGNWQLSDDANTVFVCSLCSHANQTTYSPLVKYEDLKKVLIDSLNLKIIPDPLLLQQFFDMFSCILVFKQKINKELLANGDNYKNESFHKIKYYLRKMIGSSLDFSKVFNILEEYTRSFDLENLKVLKEKGLKIVTGYEGQNTEKEVFHTSVSATHEVLPKEIAVLNFPENLPGENADLLQQETTTMPAQKSATTFPKLEVLSTRLPEQKTIIVPQQDTPPVLVPQPSAVQIPHRQHLQPSIHNLLSHESEEEENQHSHENTIPILQTTESVTTDNNL